MSQKAQIDRTEFHEQYRQSILSRRFVEYPDYYRRCEERFWKGFDVIQKLPFDQRVRALDIGGGITGVLLAQLLKMDVTVADVVETANEDVAAGGVDFATLDLFRDTEMPVRDMDLVVLQEVIEHIPQPPYIVLEKIRSMLKPGGILFLTTPNGHRLRNLLYMLAGREVLDIYRYPEAGEALGHQHEYTMKQMLWQAQRAGFEVVAADYVQDGWKGASVKARIAWQLARPAALVPRLRNSLFMTLQRPAED